MLVRKLRPVLPVIDVLLVPIVSLAAVVLGAYRRAGSGNLPISTAMLKSLGVFPLLDHYYEPLFNDTHLRKSLRDKRQLPGLDLRLQDQLEVLSKLNYQDDFRKLVDQRQEDPRGGFDINNDSFAAGDADFLYSFVRHFKPSRVIEIGCGYSTQVISAALAHTRTKEGREFEHICIEPFENDWLGGMKDIRLIRDRVEDCAMDWSGVGHNDLLFIDSSHVIRPQGDVLYEYLEIMPQLQSGAMVHAHDIFTPFDYPDEWIRKELWFWNEQYLLESLLSNGSRYEVVAALNYLKHAEFESLSAVCPYLAQDSEPGSIYFRVK